MMAVAFFGSHAAAQQADNSALHAEFKELTIASKEELVTKILARCKQGKAPHKMYAPCAVLVEKPIVPGPGTNNDGIFRPVFAVEKDGLHVRALWQGKVSRITFDQLYDGVRLPDLREKEAKQGIRHSYSPVLVMTGQERKHFRFLLDVKPQHDPWREYGRELLSAR
jgi:hypothetical protein